jgi:hypothetical protein
LPPRSRSAAATVRTEATATPDAARSSVVVPTKDESLLTTTTTLAAVGPRAGADTSVVGVRSDAEVT